MKIIFNNFLLKTNYLEKLLISLVFLFPLMLSISIFVADLFASLSALIIIVLFFFRKQKNNYSNKKLIILFFNFLFCFFCNSFFFNIF